MSALANAGVSVSATPPHVKHTATPAPRAPRHPPPPPNPPRRRGPTHVLPVIPAPPPNPPRRRGAHPRPTRHSRAPTRHSRERGNLNLNYANHRLDANPALFHRNQIRIQRLPPALNLHVNLI